MIFGSRSTFGIEIRPLSPTWERRYQPETTAWSELSIWVRERNLCRHVLEGSDHLIEGVAVPLSPLADWLVRSWPAICLEERPPQVPLASSLYETLDRWVDTRPPLGESEDRWLDERERWWSRHFVAAGAEGAIFPRLALARFEDHLQIEWCHPGPPSSASLRFVEPAGADLVAWRRAEEAVDEFVTYVATWLRREGLADLFAWVGRKRPIADARIPLLESIALYANRDVESLAELIGSSDEQTITVWLGLGPDSTTPASSPVAQVLRDLPLRLPGGMRAVLEQMDSCLREKRPGSIEAWRTQLHDVRTSEATPEQIGETSAKRLRQALDLDGEPISDAPALFEKARVTVLDPPMQSSSERMLTAMRSGAGAAVVILDTSRTRTPWGRRFELARALGHLLLDPVQDGALGAASSPFAHPTRRRRAGAFAAELLLPESALLEMTAGELDRARDPQIFATCLNRFGVGARTAAYRLWNCGLLSSASVRDDLIDEFAAASDAIARPSRTSR